MLSLVAKLATSLVKPFCRNEGGNIAITFAVASPLLFAVAGAAMDFTTYNLKSSTLQAASDAAATAAAKQMGLANATDAVITSTATNYLANQLSGDDATATNQVTVDRTKASVHVTLTENWTPFLAHFLDASITPIVASSTAVLQGNAKLCILALNPAEQQTFRMMNSAHVDGTECGIYSNSTNAKGMVLQNSSSVTAKVICSSGGVSANKSQTNVTPQTDCPVVQDPLAGLAAPPVGGCTANGYTIATGAAALTPGVYCGGIKISGTASVSFAPGTYVVKDGPLSIAGTASANGKNVGFYLIGDAAILDFNGSATIDLSGSETGALAGLLFFGARNQSDGINHKISSTNVQNLTGTIYLPTGDLTIDPNAAVAGSSAYTAIIVQRLRVQRGPTLVLNTNYGGTKVPVPEGVSSVGVVVLTN